MHRGLCYLSETKSGVFGTEGRSKHLAFEGDILRSFCIIVTDFPPFMIWKATGVGRLELYSTQRRGSHDDPQGLERGVGYYY